MTSGGEVVSGKGKQVKLFLADGTPGELVTAEITNWTGHVVAAPRSRLAALLEREEARRTGAYLLLGDDPDAVSGVRCYIGEGDEIRTRLLQHASSTRGKDFWTRVVIITSKDANLTKAHGRHLEARLVSMATAAARCTLANGTAPPPPGLPEADISDMDYFLQQLQIVLPVLGVNILRGRAAVPSASGGDYVAGQSASPEFTLKVKRHGIEARAQQIDGEFTVLAGSLASAAFRENKDYADTTATQYAGFAKLHSKLIDDGSLRPEGALLAFTRDVVFTSASTAGAIVTGRACNGRTSWKTADGLTFGDWEQRGVKSREAT